MIMHQVGVVTTFVNGDLREEVLMENIRGYKDVDPSNVIFSFNRSFYGRKKTQRILYAKNDNLFEYVFGINLYFSDHYVYVRTDPCSILIIALHVDYLLIY